VVPGFDTAAFAVEIVRDAGAGSRRSQRLSLLPPREWICVRGVDSSDATRRLVVDIMSIIGAEPTGVASNARTPDPQRFRHLRRSESGCGRVRRPVGVSLQPASALVGIGFLRLMQVSTLRSGWWTVFQASYRGFYWIAIIADALGYSTKTIERHARGAAATYAEYVATRE